MACFPPSTESPWYKLRLYAFDESNIARSIAAMIRCHSYNQIISLLSMSRKSCPFSSKKIQAPWFLHTLKVHPGPDSRPPISLQYPSQVSVLRMPCWWRCECKRLIIPIQCSPPRPRRERRAEADFFVKPLWLVLWSRRIRRRVVLRMLVPCWRWWVDRVICIWEVDICLFDWRWTLYAGTITRKAIRGGSSGERILTFNVVQCRERKNGVTCEEGNIRSTDSW